MQLQHNFLISLLFQGKEETFCVVTKVKNECDIKKGHLHVFDRIVRINSEEVCFKGDIEIKQLLQAHPGQDPLSLTVCYLLNTSVAGNSRKLNHVGNFFNSENSSSSFTSSVNFSSLKCTEGSCCNLLDGNNNDDKTGLRITDKCDVTETAVQGSRKSGDSGVNLSGDEGPEQIKLKRGHSQVSSSGSSHYSECSQRQSAMMSRKSKSDKQKYKGNFIDRSETVPLKSKESKSPASLAKKDLRFFRMEERQPTSLQIHGDAPVSMRDIDFDEITTSPAAAGE